MAKFRLPLAQSFMSRNGTLGQVDSFIQNGCLNKQGDKVYVIKRPGTILHADTGTGVDPQGAVVYNDMVYGVYSDVLHRVGGVVATGSTGVAWTQGTVPVWYARSFFTATIFKDRVYVIGGEAAQLRADISYSVDMVNWSQNASGAPFGHRQGHQACVFNGLLWVMGGFQNDATTTADQNDVWSSPDGVQWTQVVATDTSTTARWSPRSNFRLVAANNGMYVYGGGATGTLVDDVWFSSDGATWTQLTAAATGTPRELCAMFFFQNKLWIIGGYADVAGTVTIDDVNTSPDGQTWTTTAPVFGVGKAVMAYTIYNNHMWLIGGDEGGTLTSNIWASSPSGSTWSLVSTTPGFTARGGQCAIAFKTPPTINSFRYTDMWMLGGNDGVNELQQVWFGNMDLLLPTTFTLSPTTSGQSYQFNTFLDGTQLLIKNQSNLWILQSGTLIPVTDTNYPAITVPGIVVLNSFAYVMEPDGTIRACAIEDPTSWPSLQFIVADYEDDPGIAIAKYLNYLVAFGQYTIQFFYDAGNPAPGIPISPYQSTDIKIGLSFASTLVSAKATLIWVGQTGERNWGVYIMDGLAPKKVSTQWVDKAINVNLNSGARAWVTSSEGHTFYVLNFFATSTFSLVFDMDTGQWHVWINENEASMPYSYAVTEFFTGGDLWFGTGNFGGQIFSASFENYDDNGETFSLISQSERIDAESLQRKFWGQADFVADTYPATVTLDVSDDDYVTFNTWGTFDLTRQRPMLNRGGSSRRRVFRATQTDSNPAQWEALELTVSQGES